MGGSLGRLLVFIAACAVQVVARGEARQNLAFSELRAGEVAGLVPNEAFLPAAGSGPAVEDFQGTLRLKEVAMASVPARFAPAKVMGRDPGLFPSAKLGFFTDHGELVPVTQEVICCGSSGTGRSYWDLLVQPGQVWSEPGDQGWSRAAFPFALVNMREGETHNGYATFLYRGHAVTGVRYQIVQQTAPYYVQPGFTACGIVPATFTDGAPANVEDLRRRAEADAADRIPIRPWAQLVAQVGEAKLAGFDNALPPEDVLLSGLFYRGAFYVHVSRSAAGPLPWVDRMRFGVWSVTKSAFTATALLHLAKKYGPGVFAERVSAYVPATEQAAAWGKVTFGDCLNMATGFGAGSRKTAPNNIFDGEIDAHYADWYEARSCAAKLEALFRFSTPYPWPPGRVARYRDEDMFLLGVAMDRYLKKREGPGASLATTLQKEVFEPLGIHEMPMNRTLEDGGPGQPLAAFGYYPTLGDLVKIARLYSRDGSWNGRGILEEKRTASLRYGEALRGLPTGIANPCGEMRYLMGFWLAPLRSTEGGVSYYPEMMGFGGNLVAILPGDGVAIRLARSEAEGGPVEDSTGMAEVVLGLGR